MKISVHAIPHQSFLSIGSEVPIAKKSSFPPGKPRELCEFARDFIKTRVPAATPQPLRRQLPFQGRFEKVY